MLESKLPREYAMTPVPAVGGGVNDHRLEHVGVVAEEDVHAESIRAGQRRVLRQRLVWYSMPQ